MLWYAAVFGAALLVDTIPVFAPPAWTLIIVFTVWHKLNPYIAAAVGAVGSTIGRYALSLYLPKVAGKLFSRRRNENVAYLGKKIGERGWRAFFFVLIYSLTPLSTTALFTAAGAARVNPLPILPAFFIGKLLSDLVMILSGAKAYRAALKMFHGEISPKTFITLAAGLLLIGGVMFIDWRRLLEHKKLGFVSPRGHRHR